MERRWKNVDRVWNLLDRPEEFGDYVEAGVRAFVLRS